MAESNATATLDARVVGKTARATTIEITPGFDGEPWSMELDHRISGPMGEGRAAAYVTERYLLDHPYQLLTVGRTPIVQAVLEALSVAQESNE